MRIAGIEVAIGLFGVYLSVEFGDEESCFDVRVVYMHVVTSSESKEETNCGRLGNRSECFGVIFASDLGKSPSDEAGLVNRIGGIRKLDLVNELGADNICIAGAGNNGESAIFEV